MQLPNKQTTFSQFFAQSLKSASNCGHSVKNTALIAYIFPKLQTAKHLLDKSLKSLVSEHPSTVNMLKDPKHCQNWHDNTFIILFITLTQIELENVSVSDI